MTVVSRPTAPSAEDQARRAALEIRGHIGVMPFMCVGAADFGYVTTDDGDPVVVFSARIIAAGQQAPRKMLVQVTRGTAGSYDVLAAYGDPDTGEPVVHYQGAGIRPERLGSVILHLDSEV